MTRIESNSKIITKEKDKLFTFLCDLNNLEALMPDRVKDWESTRDTCTFEIEGTASLGMKIIERRPEEFIKMVEYGKVPFKFYFQIYLAPGGVGQTRVQIVLDADLNAMLKMLAVKPLTNFLNMLVDKLEEIEIE